MNRIAIVQKKAYLAQQYTEVWRNFIDRLRRKRKMGYSVENIGKKNYWQYSEVAPGSFFLGEKLEVIHPPKYQKGLFFKGKRCLIYFGDNNLKYDHWVDVN